MKTNKNTGRKKIELGLPIFKFYTHTHALTKKEKAFTSIMEGSVGVDKLACGQVEMERVERWKSSFLRLVVILDPHYAPAIHI